MLKHEQILNILQGTVFLGLVATGQSLALLTGSGGNYVWTGGLTLLAVVGYLLKSSRRTL